MSRGILIDSRLPVCRTHNPEGNDMQNATSDELDAAVQCTGWHKSGHVIIQTEVKMILSDAELEELVRLSNINTKLLLKLAIKGF